MFCQKCGREIPATVKFCPYCGAVCQPAPDKAAGAAAKPKTTLPKRQEPVKQRPSAPVYQRPNAEAAEEADTDREMEESKSRMHPALVALLVVIITAAAILAGSAVALFFGFLPEDWSLSLPWQGETQSESEQESSTAETESTTSKGSATATPATASPTPTPSPTATPTPTPTPTATPVPTATPTPEPTLAPLGIEGYGLGPSVQLGSTYNYVAPCYDDTTKTTTATVVFHDYTRTSVGNGNDALSLVITFTFTDDNAKQYGWYQTYLGAVDYRYYQETTNGTQPAGDVTADQITFDYTIEDPVSTDTTCTYSIYVNATVPSGYKDLTVWIAANPYVKPDYKDNYYGSHLTELDSLLLFRCV